MVERFSMLDIFRRHSFSITFLVIVLGTVFLLPGTDNNRERFTGFTMGTSYEVQLVGIPATTSRELLSQQVGSLLARLDREVFSTYAPNSELSRFNAHGVNVPFIASEELIEVLSLAKQIAGESDGVFDVTIGPLVNLWGFGSEPKVISEQVPSADAISAALDLIGVSKLLIDESGFEIRKSDEITIDLSGIAKGFAVDQVAQLIEEQGVSNYFIEIGGEIKVRGYKEGGEEWVPAIESPQDGVVSIYEILGSRGEALALAGSGDYRNYFELDGVRYSHEIDPRTGQPVTHDLAAAFVIHDSAAAADAYATALMILGLEEGRAFAERFNLNVYLIYRNESSELAHFVSSGFLPYIDN